LPAAFEWGRGTGAATSCTETSKNARPTPALAFWPGCARDCKRNGAKMLLAALDVANRQALPNHRAEEFICDLEKMAGQWPSTSTCI
jgi:hypothetical protein